MTSNFWRYFCAPLAWAVVLFIQSSIPDPDPPLRFSRWDDKWAHVLIYAPLGFLVMQALAQRRAGTITPALFWLAVLAGSAYGASDEIHQFFVPGRSPDWRDWVADTAGVILGAYFCLRKTKKRERAGAEDNAESYEPPPASMPEAPAERG